MELTLFELHLDEASFAANAPFSGTSEDSGRTAEGGESEGEESSGPSPVAFVVGLVFLVGIGLAVRRFMRGGGETEGPGGETAEPITA